MSLIASMFLYFISLLIYEIAYTFWILYLLTAVISLGPGKIKVAIRNSSPFVVLAVINIAITLILRSYFGTPYEGTQLDFSFTPWFVTFLKQMYAGIPLSCSISSYKIERSIFYLRDFGITDVVTLCSLWAILWYFISGQFIEELAIETCEGLNKEWTLIGLALWLLPSPLIALSVKYQAELKWGYGYLPVYISYFGIIIIVSFFITRLYRSIKSRKSFVRSTVIVIATAVGVFIVGMNYGGNRFGISSKDHDLHQRQLAIDALKDDLMKFVPEHSFILAPTPVDSRFIRMYAGLSVRTTSQAPGGIETAAGMKSVQEILQPFLYSESGDYIFDQPAQQPFLLRYEALPTGAGYAVLAALDRLSVFNSSIQGAASSKIYLYWHPPTRCVDQQRSVYAVGRWLDKDSLELGGVFKFDIGELDLIHVGSKGSVYKLPSNLLQGYADIKSLTMYGVSEDVGDSTFSKP